MAEQLQVKLRDFAIFLLQVDPNYINGSDQMKEMFIKLREREILDQRDRFFGTIQVKVNFT